MRAWIVATGVLISTPAWAEIGLYNSDSHGYKLLLADSDTCFSGTHTSIGSNTRQSLSSTTKFVCIDENKPAYPVTDGKHYKIQGGVLKEE
jgi:hypothetical protein